MQTVRCRGLEESAQWGARLCLLYEYLHIINSSPGLLLLIQIDFDKPTDIIKLCFHGNVLFSSPLGTFTVFQPRKIEIKPGQVMCIT